MCVVFRLFCLNWVRINPKMVDSSYAIVIFEEVNKKGEKLMDIVPMSWVTEGDNAEYVCKYFPNDSFDKRDFFLKNKTPAHPNWLEYPVKLLSTAESLEKAKRRLKKAKVTADVDTTDAEDIAQNTKKMSKKTDLPASKQLKQIASMSQFTAAKIAASHEISDSKYNGSESSKSQKKTGGLKKKLPQIVSDSDNSSDDGISNIQAGLKRNSLVAKAARNSESSSDDEEILQNNRGHVDHLFEERSNDASQLENLTNSIVQKHSSTSVIQDKHSRDFLQQIREIIHSEVESAKLSILHDLAAKVGQMQNTILQTNIPIAPRGSPNELIKKLDTKFAIQSLNAFLDFEKKLEDESQADALCSLYRVLLFRMDKPSNCIKTLMGHTLSKELSLQYSGSGRDMNGKHKLSWKETKTSQIMKQAIITQFTDQTEKDIQKLMATWLSGAGDRAGGRRERDEKRKDRNGKEN
ncbi:uncharacterized protein [Fopius arisanus]|uniref:DUF4806 domain-containing protein n=1 Tax=Fopius arisanus TaxID=64838 RepID=A0A9R1TRJ1_9HYME|nr:PREDICTED: uncharacterized protein LOC105272996 [Fopius arisanus]